MFLLPSDNLLTRPILLPHIGGHIASTMNTLQDHSLSSPSTLFFIFSFIYLYIHSFIWLHWALVEACWIFRCGMWDLVPWPGIEAGTPALEAQSLSHWTTREVPPPVLFCWPWATNTPCLGHHNTFPIVISKHPHFNFTIQRGTEVDYILLLQVHNKISSRFFFSSKTSSPKSSASQ